MLERETEEGQEIDFIDEIISVTHLCKYFWYV